MLCLAGLFLPLLNLRRRNAKSTVPIHEKAVYTTATMLAKLTTYALVGIDALPVEVEVDTAHGLPKTILVGLPDTAVKESVHRIERALANLGYQRPSGRTIINLAPTCCPLR